MFVKVLLPPHLGGNLGQGNCCPEAFHGLIFELKQSNRMRQHFPHQFECGFRWMKLVLYQLLSTLFWIYLRLHVVLNSYCL